jgi:hypothetical protein
MKKEVSILLDILNLWEDANKKTEVVDFFSYLIEQGGKTSVFPTNELPNFTKELPLMKPKPPVKKYELLANVLGRTLPDPKSQQFAFLPEKNSASSTGSIELTEKSYLSLYMFPWFIFSWLEGKKICFIERVNLLTPPSTHALEVKNYLEYLPYSSFLLELETPVSLNLCTDFFGGKVLYKYFIINKEDSLISLFGIPSNCPDLTYTEESSSILSTTTYAMRKIRDDYKKLRGRMGNTSNSTKLQARHLVKQIESLQAKMEVIEQDETEEFSKGFTLPCILKFDTSSNEYVHHGIDILSSDDITIEERTQFIFQLRSILNEFCRLLVIQGDVPPSVHLITDGTLSEKDSSRTEATIIEKTDEVFGWFEVPARNVDIFRVRKKDGTLSGILLKGGEKSPHPRRKHPRIYKNKKGESITIEVKESYIHKEKVQQGETPKSGTLKA